MKALLEDYKRRLKTITEELNYLGIEGKVSDSHKRLSTKASCYRTFITELEREMKESKINDDNKAQHTHKKQFGIFLLTTSNDGDLYTIGTNLKFVDTNEEAEDFVFKMKPFSQNLFTTIIPVYSKL